MTVQPFIFTLCDAATPKVNGLRDSLNGNLYVLETYSPTLGNLSKIFKVRDYLQSASHLSGDSVVLFVDAYDVLCIRDDMSALVAHFRNSGKDLITGAETVFSHHRSECLPFFLDNYLHEPARYLNSGFIIAYKWAYLKMLNHICDHFPDLYMPRHRHSDQRAISTFMLHNSRAGWINMDIDSRQQFCYTHAYDNNPLNLGLIDCYFVHVTWLALEVQATAYEAIKKHFLG